MEISKADWKLYRERVSDWQEYYMEQLTREYVELHLLEMLQIIFGNLKRE